MINWLKGASKLRFMTKKQGKKRGVRVIYQTAVL